MISNIWGYVLIIFHTHPHLPPWGSLGPFVSSGNQGLPSQTTGPRNIAHPPNPRENAIELDRFY